MKRWHGLLFFCSLLSSSLQAGPADAIPFPKKPGDIVSFDEDLPQNSSPPDPALA